MICCVSCFFFFKQKTAYEMRISDWSADVCSSDLAVLAGSCSARTTIGIAIPSHLASLGLLARPGELYGGPIAIYRMLAICERFAWCRCLKLRQSAFTAQIDRHIVREEIDRSEEHTSELQSLMRISYAVSCLKKKTTNNH